MPLLNLTALVLVLVLSIAPLFVPWGKWFAWLALMFVLAEVALVVLVLRELGEPGADGPAVIGAGLLPFIPPFLFAASATIRLACRGITSFFGAIHRKATADQGEQGAPRSPHA